MAAAREDILGRIKQALNDVDKMKTSLSEQEAGVSVHPPVVDLKARFIDKARAVKTEIIECPAEIAVGAELDMLKNTRKWQQWHAYETSPQQWLNEAGIHHSQTAENLTEVEVSVTLCEALIARTGGMLVSSKQAAGRRLGVYPPVHVVVAFTSQLISDISPALGFVQEKYGDKFPSMVSMVTGPSRTADIEKTLVLGAHGPKELIVILVDG